MKNEIKKAKKESWKQFGEEIIEEHTTDYRKFWTRIKRLRGDKGKERKAMKNKQGKTLADTKERTLRRKV